MSDKLEAYLEEIGHYLVVREERAEILSEIRSHIFEKAEREYGETTPDALEKTIAGYGSARRVAERYLDGHDIIAPAYKRYLFRYTALLFAVHLVATAAAVVFKTSFHVFPLLFVPRMGVIEALMYLPTALLCDFGITALILFLITRSRKNARLPWPKFAVDIDEVRPPGRLLWNGLGFVAMLALTGAAFYLYVRHHTIFFANLNFKTARPLFTPQAGRWFSLTLIALWAVEALRLGVRMFTGSRWVDVAKNGISLVILGLLLGRPLDDLFAVSVPGRILPYIRLSITVTLLIIAVALAVDLIKSLVIVARRRLEK